MTQPMSRTNTLLLITSRVDNLSGRYELERRDDGQTCKAFAMEALPGIAP